MPVGVVVHLDVDDAAAEVAIDERRQLVPGLSLGILLGALVIVTAWILIWIYVRWANSHYDATVTRIRETGR